MSINVQAKAEQKQAFAQMFKTQFILQGDEGVQSIDGCKKPS